LQTSIEVVGGLKTAVIRKRKQEQKPEQGPEAKDSWGPKYPNPKILLIDLDSQTETTLRQEGYNVCTGSFGTPYRVDKSDSYKPVIINGELPTSWTEQEIIVIDLDVDDVLDGPQGEKHTSIGESDWWASCSQGIVDPRPRLMACVQEHFDRILTHGGVYIIFSAPRLGQKVMWGHVRLLGFGSDLVKKEDISYDNWSFLGVLDGLEVRRDQGNALLIEDSLTEHPIAKCLLGQADESSFTCTVEPTWGSLKRRWARLARSKFGDAIAGAIVPDEREESRDKQSGWVFILPRLQDKAGFLRKFLKEVLPDLAPQLFPFVEGSRWVQRPEYELPEVLEFRRQIEDIREETEQRIESLEKAIDEERRENGYLHELLQGTGRALVLAVKTALETLGFQSVVDVDAEAEERGETGPKREDLQIHDDSPVVLVEVKGISGLSKDADALQVWKYIAPRMREWSRTDITGISIVNHQRHIPALERDNATPFREDLLTNAEEHQFGLLTTWDLFRLVRSFNKNGWRPEHVMPLFYQNGRIEPVPTHYEYVGLIQHFWPNAAAVGVQVEAESLKLGDRIAFELPVEFEEQVVESLQMDGQPVERVDPGQPAGIETHLTKDKARKGVRVFRVRD
jgi:hypothetical protein